MEESRFRWNQEDLAQGVNLSLLHIPAHTLVVIDRHAGRN